MNASERSALNGLMARLADGDRSAFDQTFAFVSPVVHRFTHRMLGGSPDAGDAAQRALLKVMARASAYDSSRDALPSILGIAAWECRTWRRKAGRRRESPASMNTGSHGAPDPEAQAIVNDLRAALDEALDTLSATDTDTILASMEEGRGPLTARVRKQLQRAVGRLRERIAGKGEKRWNALTFMAARAAPTRWAAFVARSRSRSPSFRWPRFRRHAARAGLCSWPWPRPCFFGPGAHLSRPDVSRARGGLLAGGAAWALPWIAQTCGPIGAGIPMVVLCFTGGLLSGILIAYRMRAHTHRARFLAIACTVAWLTGSMGCVLAGIGGVLGMVLGAVVGGVPVVLISPRVRPHPDLPPLRESDADSSPFRQFDAWFSHAQGSAAPHVNAATLCTSTRDGIPNARVVLLKGFDTNGFVFFTNYESQKGRELLENPRAAMVFFWPALERQVRDHRNGHQDHPRGVGCLFPDAAARQPARCVGIEAESGHRRPGVARQEPRRDHRGFRGQDRATPAVLGRISSRAHQPRVLAIAPEPPPRSSALHTPRRQYVEDRTARSLEPHSGKRVTPAPGSCG